MPNWEYTVLTAVRISHNLNPVRHDRLIVSDMNGRIDGRTDLYKTLNKLGEQGWEIHTTTKLDEGALCCILKRLRP